MTAAQGQTLKHIAENLGNLADTHALSRYDRTVDLVEPYVADDGYAARALAASLAELNVLWHDLTGR